MKDIGEFARLRLAQLPTPLHRLDNISLALKKNVYIKRDDLTGLGLGGNKVRKLEYLLADAKNCGSDVVITTGGAQSNHAMLTAACCNKLGLGAVLVLMGRGVTEKKGNLILDDILGAPVSFVDSDDYADVYAEMDRIAGEFSAQGKTPYLIPVGGSVPRGSLGYVECMRETSVQAKDMGVSFGHVICTAGSGGTLAGTTLGAAIYMPEAQVYGVTVGEGDFERITAELIDGTARLMGVRTDAWPRILPYYGEGYAIPSAEGNAAMRLMARSEGIILDPVYTGKMFAGLLELAKNGAFDDPGDLLIIHTGGAGGVFALDIE